MKEIAGEKSCSRCRNTFPWKIIVEKPKYIIFKEQLDVNIKYLQQVSGKYVIYLNCPNCGYSDIVEQKI